MTFHYSIYLHINLHLCRIIGYLVNIFFHGIMYSYVLVSINLYRSKNNSISKFLIIIQWFLAILIPLFLNQIDFKIKEKLCYINKIFLMILNILTGLFLPVIFILIFNLYVQKFRTNVNRTYQICRRQTIEFFSVSFLGWGISIFISILNRYYVISDDIYLMILSFPSISLLILSLLIKYWNKSSKKSFRNSLSSTTIRFSQPININFIQ